MWKTAAEEKHKGSKPRVLLLVRGEIVLVNQFCAWLYFSFGDVLRHYDKMTNSRMSLRAGWWWCTPLVPVLRRQRQSDL